MNEYHAKGVRSPGSGCRYGMLPPAPSGMRWYTGLLKNKTTRKMRTLKKYSKISRGNRWQYCFRWSKSLKVFLIKLQIYSKCIVYIYLRGIQTGTRVFFYYYLYTIALLYIISILIWLLFYIFSFLLNFKIIILYNPNSGNVGTFFKFE